MTFLLILFLLFFVGPYLVRWLMPILLKSFMKRAQNQMNQQYQQQEPQHKKEGEVNLNSNSKTEKPSEKDKLGDYVDFEEIEDDKSN